jgi:hypothetical protein
MDRRGAVARGPAGVSRSDGAIRATSSEVETVRALVRNRTSRDGCSDRLSNHRRRTERVRSECGSSGANEVVVFRENASAFDLRSDEITR